MTQADNVTVYYREPGHTIYHGDALEFDIPPDAVIITDPPYGLDWRATITGAQKFDKIAGDSDDRLMCWALNLPNRRVVFGAENAAHAVPPGGAWHVWDKRVIEAADKIIGSPHELLWTSSHVQRQMFRVQHAAAVNADAAIGMGGRRVHPTQKPVTLLRRIIELWTKPDDLIVDPFGGSGTTARAAKDLGRRSITIEIEERYCQAAKARLAQEALPL